MACSRHLGVDRGSGLRSSPAGREHRAPPRGDAAALRSRRSARIWAGEEILQPHVWHGLLLVGDDVQVLLRAACRGVRPA